MNRNPYKGTKRRNLFKIISLNANGYYKKGQNDDYDFDKLLKYLKVEIERNEEIIFCLQEFRVRKSKHVYEEEIEKLFECGLKIILNCKKYDDKVESDGDKYGNYLSGASEKIKSITIKGANL